MADSTEKTKGKGVEGDTREQKMRFVITSTQVSALENMTSTLL